MATIKNVSDSYVINVPLMTVNGNFIVTGNTTSVSSTNTNVKDNIITLNKGEVGSGVSSGYAGIEIDRGLLANVQIRWDETFDKWQVTSDGSTFSNIAIASPTGGLTLTANLDMLAYSIYSSSNGNVRFDDNIAIQTTTIDPPAYSGYNTVFSKTPGGGGSGLYVVNDTTASSELATQSAAIKYSIIFG